MHQLTADEAVLSRLRNLIVPVEIRDPDGRVLGHYTPVVSPEKLRRLEKARQLFDLEEADRVAAAKSQGCTTAELLQYLQSLEKKG